MPKTSYTVSLLELDYHPEVLRNTCYILNGLSCRVNVFTTIKIWNMTGIDPNMLSFDYNLILFNNKKQNIKSFFHENLSSINNSDIILFNTVASNFTLYSRLYFTPSLIVRIHNVNAWFRPMNENYKLRPSCFYLWKDFSHFIRKTLFQRDWLYRKRFMKKVDLFAFPNDIIKNYAIVTAKHEADKMISLPFSYMLPANKGDFLSKKNNHLTITLPGKICKRIRDFTTAYNAFKILIPYLENTDKHITLVLLGSGKTLYGKRIIRKFLLLQRSKFNVVWFKDFVPYKTFAEYLNTTDFFIFPMNINTRYTIYEEKYGTSKISGSINEMIASRKPALIPSGYHLEENLKLVSEPYSNAIELSVKIKEWCETESFRNFNFEEAFRPYHPHIIQEQYNTLFQRLVRSC